MSLDHIIPFRHRFALIIPVIDETIMYDIPLFNVACRAQQVTHDILSWPIGRKATRPGTQMP
jgi:hypothetical protein